MYLPNLAGTRSRFEHNVLIILIGCIESALLLSLHSDEAVLSPQNAVQQFLYCVAFTVLVHAELHPGSTAVGRTSHV